MFDYNKMVRYYKCRFCHNVVKKLGRYKDKHRKCLEKHERYLLALKSIEDLDIIPMDAIKMEFERI